MKSLLTLISILIFFTQCQKKQKDFGQVQKGMTKSEVLSLTGEPDQKNTVGPAEFWTYRDSNRTIGFRKDTVYNIMTSPEARADSIRQSVREAGRDLKEKSKEAGQEIKEGLKKAGEKIDTLADTLKGER